MSVKQPVIFCGYTNSVLWTPKGWSSVCSTTVQEVNGYLRGKKKNQTQSTEIQQRCDLKTAKGNGTAVGLTSWPSLGNLIFEIRRSITSGEKWHYWSDCVSVFTWMKSAHNPKKLIRWLMHSSLSWIVPWYKFGWSDFSFIHIKQKLCYPVILSDISWDMNSSYPWGGRGLVKVQPA